MKKITSLILSSMLSRMLFAFILLLSPMLTFAETVKLPQTGQTSCYDENGTAITCSGTGQDGELQIGAAWPSPRFTDNNDGTVKDNLTGLIWVKDGNLMKTRDPLFDKGVLYTDDNAGDGLVNWQRALDYVKKLNQEQYLGYNDWRLPNVTEMETLVNAGQAYTDIWLNSMGFINVSGHTYWSSTSSGATERAYCVLLWYGAVNYDFKSHTSAVWPVRTGQGGAVSLPQTGQTKCWNNIGVLVTCAGTGQDGDLRKGTEWPNPRFTDNGNSTITDNLTGLIWTKDATAPGPTSCGPGAATMTWKDALDYVKCLNINNYLGYNDWRLPNRKELSSLINYSQSGSLYMSSWLNSQGFYNVMGYYYCSSSSVATHPYLVWEVEMSTVRMVQIGKNEAFFVWPVRAGEVTTSCTYTLSPYSAGFDATVAQDVVIVTPSSSSCSWSATSNASWITITAGSAGTGNGTVSYSVSANTGSTRTGTMTIGGRTFTVTQNGSGPSPAGAFYFPHVATSIPWQTEIAIINTSPDQTVTGTLRALSDEGQLIETKDVTLSVRGRRQIIVADEFTNHINIGYIIFDTGSDTVQGYTKFYWEGHYRAAIPAVKEVNTSDIYISHIASNADWWTGVSLVNTTSATKALTITFNNGQSRQFTLNANQHRAFNIAQEFFNNQPPPDIQSAVITNASGVIGLELFGSIGGNDHLDGILLTDNTASTIYYPHVASNNEWWTGIVAYNPSESECTITITPYNAQGASLPLSPSTRPIPGKGKYIGTVTDLGLPAQTAWFKIDSTRLLSGFELFGTIDGNQLAAYAGGGGTGARVGVFPKIEKYGGWTGIAFVNTEACTASVTLTAYNDNGTAVATQVLTVDGYAKVVNLAEAIFSQDIRNATYIAFSSDRNVVGFQLNGSLDGTMLDGLPSFDCATTPVLSPTTYSHLLIIYLNTDVAYIKNNILQRFKGSMSNTLKTTVVNAFKNLPNLIKDGSGGLVSSAYEIVEISDPITKITNLAGDYYWLSYQDIQTDLELYAPKGKYDSVHVVWNNGPIDAYWGLGGAFINYGTTTFSSLIAAQEWWWTGIGEAYGEPFLHEWLHGVCLFYESLGYFMPTRNADGAEYHGYTKSSKDGWMKYYRDLMQGQVWEPTLSRYTGITKEAWGNGSPNNHK